MTTTGPSGTSPNDDATTAGALEFATALLHMRDPLEYAAALLRMRGQARDAESVEAMCRFLDGYRGDSDTYAGLTVLLAWARREATDPLLVRPGDRVRVFAHNGAEITTGVWKREPGTGAPLVQRDDTGEDLRFSHAVHRIELLYLDPGARTGGTMTGALWAAATVLRSMWLPRTSTHLDEVEEYPENDAEREAREEYEQRRARERFCACGELATWRVIAWAEREAVELDGHGFPWREPATYGVETVCSQGCGEGWGRKFLDQAVLPPDVELVFRLERFTYRAEAEELPATLCRARAAATRAANVLDGACTAHVAGEPGSVGTLTQSARGSVAELLDAVLLLTTPRVV